MLDPISQMSRFLSPERHKKLDNLPRMSFVGKTYGSFPAIPALTLTPTGC